MSDLPVHFGLAVSFPEGHSAGRTAGAHDSEWAEERAERGERGRREGRARFGTAQGACRDSSRHQMAAHTGRCPMGPGRVPSSRDSGLRHATHPGAELPEPGKRRGARKGKESKTKHHRKVPSLVFMEFES